MIEIRKLSLKYGAKSAIEDISLDIPKRPVTAFIGPSGCGN
ncbi:MAG: phosphate ABC transporter ATP-binding protein, partial [candidate division NC10 bacterium]|nr:phosphate ABC transporter ATP-binding protein [candidate division NC10 bacterium]